MRKKPGKPARAKPAAASSAPALGAAERALIAKLAERTRLPPREVVARALAAYASAVAPDLAQTAAPGESRGGKTLGHRSAPAAKPLKLFYSVDGGPEREIARETFFGRDPSCEVRLDMPLIADRHARVAPSGGRWLFEDLKSPRGSFKGGQPIQAAFLESGDEIDLGGFLPVRFRLADR